MAKEQRDKDREQELALQDSVEIAVANRNLQIIKGADPDPNVGTGFYPGEQPAEESVTERPIRRRRRGRPRKEV